MKLLKSKERSIVVLSFFVVLSLLAILPSSYASDVGDLRDYTQNRQANTISTQVVVSRNKDSGLLGYGPVFEERIGFNSCTYFIDGGVNDALVLPADFLILSLLNFIADKINPYFNGYKDGDWITITSSIPVTGSFNISYNRFSYTTIDTSGIFWRKNRRVYSPPINVYAYKDNQLFFSQENINGGLVQLPEIEEPAYLTIKIYAPIRDDSSIFNTRTAGSLVGQGCSYSEIKFITLSRLKSD